MGVLPKYLTFTMISVCIWINENGCFLELIWCIHRLRHTNMCISSCKCRKCVALLGLLKCHSNIWERKHSWDIAGSYNKEAAKKARVEDCELHTGYERGVKCLSPPCLWTNMCYLFTYARKETWQLLSVKTAELQAWRIRGSSPLLCFFLLLSRIFASPTLTAHSALFLQEAVTRRLGGHMYI